MQFPYSKDFIDKLHHLYTKTDLTLDEVGEQMGLKRRQISGIIKRMRGLDPDRWPKRYPKPDNRMLTKRRKRDGPKSDAEVRGDETHGMAGQTP